MSHELSAQQIDRHVGLSIRRRRIALGQKQPELAAACGLTFQQIQKYETGINRVSASKLHQIAAAQQVTVAFYFQGLPAAQAIIERETEEVLALARRLIAFPPETRTSILNIVDALEASHG